MPKSPSLPVRFGLKSFSDLLPPRDPILGGESELFATFRNALTRSLAPATSYEALLAENLVNVEFELIQHRRPRDAAIRQNVRDAIDWPPGHSLV